MGYNLWNVGIPGIELIREESVLIVNFMILREIDNCVLLKVALLKDM